jgi:hypothetical protein
MIDLHSDFFPLKEKVPLGTFQVPELVLFSESFQVKKISPKKFRDRFLNSFCFTKSKTEE